MIDFERIFNDYFVEHWTHGKNVAEGWVNTQCPHCSDKSNHLGFCPATGACMCWKCGGHSTSYSLSVIIGCSPFEAEKILREYSTSEIIQKRMTQKIRARASSIDLPGDKLQDKHKKYLIKRGFDPELIEAKYKIRGTGHIGEWAHRIIIPIYYEERIVSFQSRDITGKADLRYKTLEPEKEIMFHKHLLYNLDNCKKERAMLVEGVFDVWRFGDNVLSSFGTSLTKKQLRLLSDTFTRVFILFDPGREAQQAAKEVALYLNDTGTETELLLLDEGDPAEMKKSEAVYLKKNLGL